MGARPVRIAAAGDRALDVDQVLHRQRQAVERTAAGRRAPATRAGQEGVVEIGLHLGRHQAPSAAMTSSEPVTKPKHFLTFQTVASVQKAGDDVAQQSSSMTQP